MIYLREYPNFEYVYTIKVMTKLQHCRQVDQVISKVTWHSNPKIMPKTGVSISL